MSPIENEGIFNFPSTSGRIALMRLIISSENSGNEWSTIERRYSSALVEVLVVTKADSFAKTYLMSLFFSAAVRKLSIWAYRDINSSFTGAGAGISRGISRGISTGISGCCDCSCCK